MNFNGHAKLPGMEGEKEAIEMKHFRINVVISVILLIYPLMFITTKTAHGGINPPPTGNEHLAGPAIIGQVIISPLDENGTGIHVNFMGNCKGSIPVDFEFDIDSIDFNDVTKETLKYQRAVGAAALVNFECSRLAEGDLIINSVIRFEEIDGSSPVKMADVVVLFVAGRGR